MLKSLWNDEVGAILGIEIILVGTVLGIGTIAGLATLRDVLVAEMTDVCAAAGVDQSYSLVGRTFGSSMTADSTYTDNQESLPSSGAVTCTVVGITGENGATDFE